MSRAATQPRPGPSRPAGPPAAGGKLLVLSLRCGRLANRLVLFANFIALAEQMGLRLSNVTFHSYAHLFETTRRDIYCRYPLGQRRSFLEFLPGLTALLRKTRLLYHGVHAASRMNEALPIFGQRVVTLRELPGPTTLLEGPEVQARIGPARLIFAYGWRFRAPACMVRHAAKVRAYFRPIEALDQASRQPVERLRRQADVVVGVHVRQGDYRTWNDGRCFFTPDRYAAWMGELARQLPGRKTAFLVCSDEPRHEREFAGLTVAFGPGPALVDLYALSRCDYILGPLGTFSQWASFYGNKPLLHLREANDAVKLKKFAVSDLAEIP